MIFRAHHLHDDRLFDCYVSERGGETLDPRTAEHLTDCAECSTRYSEIARFMDGLRADADAETDAVFSADRLRAQQQAIARRLELVGRPARVISFPGAATARSMAKTASRVAPRWVAAAAAAGLFVGAGLGASYEWQRGLFVGSGVSRKLPGRTPSTAAPSPSLPVGTDGDAPADVAADEAFLSELEVALDRPRTRELRAYDELTPHFKEIRDVR